MSTVKLNTYPALYYGLLGPLIGLAIINFGIIVAYLFEEISGQTNHSTPFSSILEDTGSLIVINVAGLIVAYLVGFIPALITGFFAAKSTTPNGEALYAIAIGASTATLWSIPFDNTANPQPALFLCAIGAFSGGACAFLRRRSQKLSPTSCDQPPQK